MIRKKYDAKRKVKKVFWILFQGSWACLKCFWKYYRAKMQFINKIWEKSQLIRRCSFYQTTPPKCHYIFLLYFLPYLEFIAWIKSWYILSGKNWNGSTHKTSVFCLFAFGRSIDDDNWEHLEQKFCCASFFSTLDLWAFIFVTLKTHHADNCSIMPLEFWFEPQLNGVAYLILFVLWINTCVVSKTVLRFW